MKIRQLFPIIFLFFFGCEEEIKLIKELPDNISTIDFSENFVEDLWIFLPNGRNFFLNNPDFFSDTIQKNIVLTKESMVYVSFIDEGAFNKNSLFWYSYNISKPPLIASDIKGNVLFPNISKIGEGGLLEPGYTLQLGTQKFPAGTVIGFFLIVSGWKNGIINYNNPIHYTDYSLNISGKQQHILFKHSDSKVIVMGFEDISVSDVELSSDNDFNDVLFSVSDNNTGFEAMSFDLRNVIIR